MNSVLLIGRLTKDPELRYGAGSQTAVCKFTVAVDRGKDRDGNDLGADFPRVTVFGKQGENCDRYLAKGRLVAVQGRIQTGSYQNKEGVTVYTTDVVADRVEFLGSGSGNNGNGGGRERTQYQSRPQERPQEAEAPREEAPTYDDAPQGFEALDEDIPF